MAPRIVILADDLSGAADCAMACHRAGMAATTRTPSATPISPASTTWCRSSVLPRPKAKKGIMIGTAGFRNARIS